MNVPNILTICRFLLIPIYLLVFSTGQMKLAFLVVVLAGATDVLDGYLARKTGQITQAGVMLDPLADKCMMIAVILSLLITDRIPWPAAVIFFIRDVGMILGSAFFHFRGKRTVPANAMGKLTTVMFYVAFLFIFFELPFAIPYLWFVIGFSFITSISYIVMFKSLNRQTDRM